MPSNSPGVNSLWLPAIPLKVPVVLKPGRDEPWTPCRLIQALVAAGCPAAAFGFYPTDHEGAAEMLRGCGRALVFGDKNTTAPYADNPAIQVSRPRAQQDSYRRRPDRALAGVHRPDVSSIAENGGRSCINASAVVVPKYAAEIADTALAQSSGRSRRCPPDKGARSPPLPILPWRRASMPPSKKGSGPRRRGSHG